MFDQDVQGMRWAIETLGLDRASQIAHEHRGAPEDLRLRIELEGATARGPLFTPPLRSQAGSAISAVATPRVRPRPVPRPKQPEQPTRWRVDFSMLFTMLGIALVIILCIPLVMLVVTLIKFAVEFLLLMLGSNVMASWL
jgi:hypothetical protein